MNWLHSITLAYLQERTLETLAKKHDVSVEEVPNYYSKLKKAGL